VLREIGYSEDRIDALIQSGATATVPGASPASINPTRKET
jgi:hypothetical protein